MFGRRDAIYFACVILVALAAFLPMRVVVGAAGLSGRGLAARDVSGTMWAGALRDARIGRVPLGDLQLRLGVPSLLLGRLSFSFSGPTAGSSGTLFASPSRFGFADVDASMATNGLLAPLPLTRFDLQRVSVTFGRHGCAEAGGLVRAQTGGPPSGLSLPPSFSGTPRCQNGLLLVPLASTSGMEAIQLRIDRAGRYEADLIVRTSDPATIEGLRASGFQRTSRGYATKLRGSF